MAKDDSNTKWHLVTNQEAKQLATVTTCPGCAFPYDIGSLPEQLKGLPGLSVAYISGFATPSNSAGMNAAGALVATRQDRGLNKSYVYFFAIANDQIHFSGPRKDFDEHHVKRDDPVPFEKILHDVSVRKSIKKEP